MINEGLEKAVAPTLREWALAIFRERVPDARMDHLKTVEKTAREGYGGHFEGEIPGFTIEDLGPIDAFGSRARNIISSGTGKYSTTFPKAWGEELVCKKVQEAWRNPVAGTERKSGLVGKTAEGMYIELWLRERLKTGQIFINSGYPISPEKLAETIAKNMSQKG